MSTSWNSAVTLIDILKDALAEWPVIVITIVFIILLLIFVLIKALVKSLRTVEYKDGKFTAHFNDANKNPENP